MIGPTFIFFGGKGGVGKTTCAAARAVAEARKGADVLLISTDPAHSLGDALAVPLSGRVSRVPVGRARALAAVELDAPGALARWMREHRRALGDAIEHGTWLDRADVAELLDLSVPGVDELVAMLEIVRLAGAPDGPRARRRRPSARQTPRPRRLVIVDTAPTGHTLRLLAAPDALGAVARLLDAMQERHRAIREEFGSGAAEASDALLATMAEQAAVTGALLRDASRTAFSWVTLPERLSMSETTDALAALRLAGIPVRELIVNRAWPDGPTCRLCDRRRAEERRVVSALRRTVRLPARLIAAQLVEPRGARRLAQLALAPADRPTRSASASRRPSDQRLARTDPRATERARAHLLAAWNGARVILFGGKGGVGKTTCAAAAAMRLARLDPARPVLLLSTDPAHSLGDVLRMRAGDAPMAVPRVPNLFVRELDAAAAFAARRARIESAIAEISLSIGAEGLGNTAAGGLLDLAPPGIDELFGILAVVGERRAFPLIVVDTAPTGHTLRLLELPDAARGWVQLLMRVLLKYRAVVKAADLAGELVDLSRSIRDFDAMLHDPAAARFLVVTRAAELPRAETARLLRRLEAMRLASPAVIVNATTPPDGCSRCRAIRATERRELAALVRGGGRRRCAIIEAPLVAPPPVGSTALERWAASWTA